MTTCQRFAALLSLTALVLALPATAGELFTATLNGANAGSPSSATGTATIVLNDDGTAADFHVTFSGLVGTEVQAHFHNGPPGRPGPIVLPLELGSPKIGTWNLTPFDVEQLRLGFIYVMIHTDIYFTGEIRGDFTSAGVSNTTQSWGAVKSLFR